MPARHRSRTIHGIVDEDSPRPPAEMRTSIQYAGSVEPVHPLFEDFGDVPVSPLFKDVDDTRGMLESGGIRSSPSFRSSSLPNLDSVAACSLAPSAPGGLDADRPVGFDVMSKTKSGLTERSNTCPVLDVGEVSCNDEGAIVAVGNNRWTGSDGTRKYYCGRFRGTAALPANSDGFCGPNNGPQCPSCQRFQTEQSPFTSTPSQRVGWNWPSLRAKSDHLTLSDHSGVSSERRASSLSDATKQSSLGQLTQVSSASRMSCAVASMGKRLKTGAGLAGVKRLRPELVEINKVCSNTSSSLPRSSFANERFANEISEKLKPVERLDDGSAMGALLNDDELETLADCWARGLGCELRITRLVRHETTRSLWKTLKAEAYQRLESTALLSPRPVQHRGVKLRHMKELFDTNLAFLQTPVFNETSQRELRPTTLEVQQEIVGPESRRFHCSYAELVPPQSGAVFVSHWWGEEFEELYLTIHAHASNNCPLCHQNSSRSQKHASDPLQRVFWLWLFAEAPLAAVHSDSTTVSKDLHIDPLQSDCLSRIREATANYLHDSSITGPRFSSYERCRSDPASFCSGESRVSGESRTSWSMPSAPDFSILENVLGAGSNQVLVAIDQEARVLTRSWCLYEILQGLWLDRHIDFCTSDGLLNEATCLTDTGQRTVKRLQHLELVTAASSQPQDAQSILQWIARSAALAAATRQLRSLVGLVYRLGEVGIVLRDPITKTRMNLMEEQLLVSLRHGGQSPIDKDTREQDENSLEKTNRAQALPRLSGWKPHRRSVDKIAEDYDPVDVQKRTVEQRGRPRKYQNRWDEKLTPRELYSRLAVLRRLVVVAPAGAGKTVLMQQLLYCAMHFGGCSGEGSLDKTAESGGREHVGAVLPICVPLRDLVALLRDKPKPPADMMYSWPPDLLRAWIHEQFGASSTEARTFNTPEDFGFAWVLVILEGFDEVLDEERQWVKLWLERYVNTHPDGRWIILTARPEAFQLPQDAEWLLNLGFRFVDLLKMNSRTMIEMCRRRLVDGYGMADSEMDPLLDIASEPRYAIMVERPFLATLLIHVLKRKHPVRIECCRADVYSCAIEMMLEEPHDAISRAHFVPNIRSSHAQVASAKFRAHRSPNFAEAEEKARERMMIEELAFSALMGGTRCFTDSVVPEQWSASGVFKPAMSGFVQVSHLTILEYLASCHIMRQIDDYGELRNSLQEVLKLPYMSEVLDFFMESREVLQKLAGNLDSLDEELSAIASGRMAQPLLKSFQGHTGAVLCCAVFPDGSRILTGSADNTARIWNAQNGTQLVKLGEKPHRSWVCSCAVFPKGDRVMTGGADNTARIWDALYGTHLYVLVSHTDSVSGCAVFPCSTKVLTASSDSALHVWDIRKATLYMPLDSARSRQAVCISEPDVRLQKHTKSVLGCAIFPDGERVISASADGSAIIWKLKPVAPVAEIQKESDIRSSPSPERRTPPRCAVTAFHIEAMDDLMTAPICSAPASDSASAPEVLHVLCGHSDEVCACAIFPDSESALTVSKDETARIWDVATGELLLVHRSWGICMNARTACGAVFSDGTRVLTSIGMEGERGARVWDARTGREPAFQVFSTGMPQEPRPTVVTMEGQMSSILIADGPRRRRRVHKHMWIGSAKPTEVETSAEFRTIESQDGNSGGATLVCAIFPDGVRVVTAGEDKVVRIWSVVPPREDYLELELARMHGASRSEALPRRFLNALCSHRRNQHCNRARSQTF